MKRADAENRPPPLVLLAREALLFPAARIRAAFAPAVKRIVRGDGQTVIVIPGFMATDRTTSRLRKSLSQAGFACHGWGMGRNMGVTSDILERLECRISEIGPDGPVILIGWSLGGLFAREYAKYAPQNVSKVITLGSPFSGGPRANHGWRLYERVAGHKVDCPPVQAVLHYKPPVPTVAIWSPRDGIVASKAARGLATESDLQVQLGCSHMGFIADPDVIRHIATVILN